MEKLLYSDLIDALDNPANKKSQEIIKQGEEIVSRINPSKNSKYYNMRAKLLGFVNNHIIEMHMRIFLQEKMGKYYIVDTFDPYYDYLTDRYIIGDYPDFYLVDDETSLEVKRYNYVDQVKLAMQDIVNYKKAENKTIFNRELKKEFGRFVAIHNADIVLFAVLKENKIVWYDTKSGIWEIFDYYWSGIRFYN